MTALTSSFRKHLDAIHPQTAGGEDGKQKAGNAVVANDGRKALHSSAALADKHLASVLTSPLLSKQADPALTKADQAYGDAKVEFASHPERDPIALLEDYQEQGKASVMLARLCLEKFRDDLKSLSPEARNKIICESEPGRRTLLWLWRSELYETPECVDDRDFMPLLVPFLVEEGHEEYLWEWIKMDVALADDDPKLKKLRKMYHRYRWKGRVLRGLILCKIGPPSSEPKSLEPALDAYFKACDLKLQAQEGSHMSFFPLGQAVVPLYRCITRPAQRHNYRPTDSARYDRLVEVAWLSNENSFIMTEVHRATLQLVHPEHPTAQPILKVFEQVFSDNSPPIWRGLHRMITDPTSDLRGHYWYSIMVDTVKQLQEEGDEEAFSWLTARIRDTFPQTAEKYLDQHLEGRGHRKLHHADSNTQASSAESAAPGRVPSPTFA